MNHDHNLIGRTYFAIFDCSEPKSHLSEQSFECFVYFVVLSIAEHLAVIVGFLAAVSECLEQAVRNPWLIVLKKSATVHHGGH